jgi:Predicted methyltransferase regulatory domain/Methyltransferase domain
MSAWSSGYVSEIPYTYGYYRELSPDLLNLAVLLRLHKTRTASPLRYLELGFGQGLSLNIHAAARDGEFWGTDFNPLQAANAKELAEASGANLRVQDLSFAEFAASNDLPEFDIIALHGIWSWISEANREHLVDILRRKLAVGGICYLSYNCTPGWSPSIPLRHLMMLHAEIMGAESKGLVNRIDDSIEFAQQVIDTGAQYFKSNPAVAERLKQIKAHGRNYLAHEYFNADWEPMPFSEVASALAEAKLNFVGSANLLDHVDALNLTGDAQKFLGSITSPVMRESVRDYFVNQQFRRDIFLKGARPISVLEQTQYLRAMGFVLLSEPADIGLKIKVGLGEAKLQEQVYQPVIAALAFNQFAPKTIAELEADAGLKGLSFGQLVQALVVLTGAGHVLPARAATATAAAKPKTLALNSYLQERAVRSDEISFLASPVTGGGVVVPRFHQLFLRARTRCGLQSNGADWAKDVWATFLDQGQRLVKDGKAVESSEQNLAELTRQAQEFEAKRLPVMKALQIA